MPILLRQAVASALLIIAPALAEAAPAACKVLDRSAAVAIVLCPPAPSREALRAAGEAACKARSPCNAWIWDDAAQVPAKAPKVDTDLPKPVAGTAQAIWLQDSTQLIELRRPKTP